MIDEVFKIGFLVIVIALAIFFFIDGQIAKVQLYGKDKAIADFSQASKLVMECRLREDQSNALLAKANSELSLANQRIFQDENVLNYVASYFNDTNQLKKFSDYVQKRVG